MTESKRPLKVFLCHSSADKPKVREVYRSLQKMGFQPWLDAEDLIPGQDWALEIPRALDGSDAIIVFISKGSVDKEGYVQKEIKFALDRALEMPEGRIFLIPARLEECELPYSLKKYQWVNLYEEDGYQKLINALKIRGEQLQRADAEPPAGKETPVWVQQTAIGSQPRPKPRVNTAIVVALIGLVGTIIAGLLSSPLLLDIFKNTPVPSTIPSSLPSSSFNDLPTATAQPTNTVAVTPSQVQVDETWSGPVSVRMPTLNEIREDMLSIWDANGLSLGDMSSPDIRSFTGTANANQEYLWPIYWCAIDRPTLDINVTNITTIFTVNGETVPDESIFDYYYDSNSGWKCNYRASVIGQFTRNASITLRVTREFKTDIFDGQETYPAGSYTYELVLSVK